jgi:hypothetical protein
MAFKSDIKLVIVDKLIIGLLLLGCTWWTTRRIEGLKHDWQEKAEKRAELSKELSDFYYPVTLRIAKDNMIWKDVLGGRNSNAAAKFGAELEKTLIMKNHDDIVAIIEGHLDVIKDDEKLMALVSQLEEHVALYNALRAAGDDKHTPQQVDDKARWPEDLYPILQERTKAVEKQVEALSD